MPIIDDKFKKCTHGTQTATIDLVTGRQETTINGAMIDWRDCYQCIAEVMMQLTIARTYLRELAMADFNDNGDCKKPLAEPIQGRHFTQIAATGLAAASD